MVIIKKILIIGFAILLLTGCDLTSKRFAKQELKGKNVRSYIGGNLKLFYTENPAGMLGLGEELPEQTRFFIFVILTSVLLLFLYIYIVLKKDIGRWHLVAFVLFLSGGFGNLIDRIIHSGKVTDFIVIEFSSLHTGIFNIADLYVTIGVIIFIISHFYQMRKDPKEKLPIDYSI